MQYLMLLYRPQVWIKKMIQMGKFIECKHCDRKMFWEEKKFIF